jgi:peptidoglycan/xylan/chitin deacetylase (PgdA/CDA1 family)
MNTFIGYLKYLRENHWQVIDITTFLHGLTEPNILPDRSSLLTFDDGYRSIREVALPLLRRFGFPAVLFIPTNYIGGQNTFDDGVEPEEAICDWDDLKELERHCVSIQSHSVRHKRFSELNFYEQKEELVQSKAKLEAGLGKRVEVIAYPYGDDGGNSQALSKVLKRIDYRAACLYGGDPNLLPIKDPYRLTRLALGPDSDLQAALG